MVREEKPRTVYWLDDKLYLNITNRCSNRCVFCFRNFKRGVGGFTLKLDCEPSFEEIINELKGALSKRAWREVVFCGFGEPTERLDLLLSIARWIKQNLHGVPVRLNTNGQGSLHNPARNVIAELKTAGVGKVSVSLNAEDETTYGEICKPTLKNAYNAAIDFINKAKTELDVEVSAVTTPEIEIYKIKELANKLGVKFRTRQCIPCFW